MCRTHASSFYKNLFKYTLYISVLYSNLHVSPRKNKIGYNVEIRHFHATIVSVEKQ